MKSSSPIIFILFLSTFQPAYTQKKNYYVDRKIQSHNSSPAHLAEQLTRHYKTDLEKVRSIFHWIAGNIDYRIRLNSRKNHTSASAIDIDDTSSLKTLDERVAENVLKYRLAVCDGYSRLFKTLCEYSGIKAEVITGYGRTESGRMNKRFHSNHTWNAVQIDGKWHLLDVTWASGFLTWSGNEFIRKFDENYFLSNPANFIQDHYPDELKWTLLEDPPIITEYRHTPFRQRSFIKYQISSFAPAKGLIKARISDTLYFSVATRDALKDKLISGDPFLDTSLYQTPHSVVLIPAESESNKVSYSYFVTSPEVRWIYLLYNNDLILRYRLDVSY